MTKKRSAYEISKLEEDCEHYKALAESLRVEVNRANIELTNVLRKLRETEIAYRDSQTISKRKLLNVKLEYSDGCYENYRPNYSN